LHWRGGRRPAREVLDALGLEPLVLEAKEGLALINGTQAMSAQLALLLLDAARLLRAADVAAAMSVEALKGSHRPFLEAVVRVRPHPGAATVAANLRRLLDDSAIQRSHVDCDKVQDAYSLRAVPQVHGASRDALAHVRAVLEIELDSVTDNPLVFDEDDEVISAGNFHGQPLALAADYAAIALAELASISERRVEQMLNPALSGLPAFLAEQGGLHSGLMVSQYTAAALVSENKVLAHPASVDSIPTSANQEDHVSMGTHACRKARQVLDNVLWVIAIEVVSAAQALDFQLPLQPGSGVQAAYTRVRAWVPHLDRDRLLRPDLERVRRAIRDGSLVAAVEDAVGPIA
jgi:histidine ammonia-lyase